MVDWSHVPCPLGRIQDYNLNGKIKSVAQKCQLLSRFFPLLLKRMGKIRLPTSRLHCTHITALSRNSG